MATLFRILDLATQPRILLPVLFPVMASLGWRRDRTGRLRQYLLAALAIDGLGFLLAMGIEALPLESSLINTLQGVALVIVALTIFGVWHYNEWSTFVQGWALVAAVSVAVWLPARQVFTLSGGVLIPTASVLYLVWEDWRLAPLVGIPVFRVAVGGLREGYTAVDVVVALLLSVATVLFVRGTWSQHRTPRIPLANQEQ